MADSAEPPTSDSGSTFPRQTEVYFSPTTKMTKSSESISPDKTSAPTLALKIEIPTESTDNLTTSTDPPIKLEGESDPLLSLELEAPILQTDKLNETPGSLAKLDKDSSTSFSVKTEILPSSVDKISTITAITPTSESGDHLASPSAAVSSHDVTKDIRRYFQQMVKVNSSKPSIRLLAIMEDTEERLKNESSQEGKIKCEKIGISGSIHDALKKLDKLKSVSKSFAKYSKLEVSLIRIKNSQYGYSQNSIDQALSLYVRFKAQNFEDDTASVSDVEEEVIEISRPEPVPKKMDALNLAKNLKRRSVSDNFNLKNKRRTILPSQHDKIFGPGGIMNSMIKNVNEKTGRHSYSLDPSKHKKSSGVYGANGLTVGEWWPTMLCLVRDGVHGASQGGIYGTATRGAFSIIVTGRYDDLDYDELNTLFYSGTGSHDNKDPKTTVMTTGTQALQRSAATKNAIRVIRGQGKGKFSISHGYRYDGLYQVVSEKPMKNSKGGAYLRFKLERIGGQDEIDLGVPDG